MTIRTRLANLDDVPSIAGMARELNKHQGDPVDLFTEAAIRRDGFGPIPEFTVFLAEQDRRAVGYALFYPCYETGHAARGLYLSDLYVEPESRRMGVGRALVAAVAAESRRQNRIFVWWASKRWNTAAQSAYRAFGAIEEPVVAHAVFAAPFDELASEADERAGEVDIGLHGRQPSG